MAEEMTPEENARFEKANETAKMVLKMLKERHTPGESALVLAMAMGRCVVAADATDEAFEAMVECARGFIHDTREALEKLKGP